jgi:acyl-CoA synthetase (AMP-forming)/AMP-acid ligase II/pimeloyl-ACP methyl ester carboxylesterase
MHYLDEGNGPVVILLHGNPTWCFYYRNLIRELRQYFRVIAPDHIGCGLSDHPTDSHFRAVDRRAHLQELLAQLGITKFSLVMHDWGGPIGTGLAVRMIPSIEKLVYLNTTLTETESLPRVIKTAANRYIGPYLTKRTKRFLKLTTGIGAAKKMPKEIRAGYYYPYATSARRTALWDFVQDIPFDSDHPSYGEMMNMAEKLPELGHVPVQIVWGLKDICFHREMLNKVAQHFPQARIREIPEASHLVLEDAPDICCQTIRSFLLGEHDAESLARQTASTRTQRRHALYSGFRQFVDQAPHTNAAIKPAFFPDTVRYTQVNYKELGNLVFKYERGLTELGMRAGDRVLMLVQPGVEFLALSYAVMGRGAIPVFVDPGIGVDNICKCILDAEPNVFIGSPRAHLLRYFRKQVFTKLRFSVCANEWLALGKAHLGFLKKFSALPLPDASVPDAALIAFTSGATGTPKGVVFSQEMVADQLRIFRDLFALRAGGCDLPLLPIFSLFSAAIGVSSVFPPIDSRKPLSLEPEKIVRVIDDLAVTSSFGSPTLWKKIAEYCVRTRTVLSSLERVYMAGAPVPISTLQRVQEVIPRGKAYTPYGATEALPVTLVSGDTIAAAGVFQAASGEIGTLVGQPIEGIKLRIIESRDEPIADISQCKELPPGNIGEIIVSGKNVAAVYLSRPDATKRAKIKDSEKLWHRMGDLGYVDASGNLYFCGRQAHAVRSAGRLYLSIPVERIFNPHEKVKRSALVAFEREARCEAAVVIEPYPQFWPQTQESREEFRNEMLALARDNNLTSNIEKIFFHPSFPVDARHNAKIFRDKLGNLASQGKIH